MDTSCMATARTGAGTFVREITRVFREKYADQVIELAPPPLACTGQGFLQKIKKNLQIFKWVQSGFPRAAQKRHCQVLLSPEYLTPYFSALPRMVVVYDATFIIRTSDFNPLWRRFFLMVYLPAIRNAQKIITISEAAKKDLISQFKIKEEKIDIVHCGCDQKKFAPVPTLEIHRVLAKYNLPNKKYFLHVGVLEKRKNLPTLIRAFGRIRQSNADCELVLAGPPGPMKDLNDESQIRNEIRRLGLEKAVKVLGFIPSEDLGPLYRGALAKIFPTSYEGFGIPILEAFASQLPVLCSHLPVLEEVAGEGAFYFDPTDEDEITRAMQTFLTNQGLRDRLKQHGQPRLKLFSWEVSAEKIISLAHEVARNIA
jgi:glycosyltransferase involved in cell wall biosynthesis